MSDLAAPADARYWQTRAAAAELMRAWELNPLVCECPNTRADLRRNFGECPVCKRKPLALMGVRDA